MGLYVFYGDDSFSRHEALLKLRQSLVDPAFAALSHKIIESPTAEQALEVIGSVSLAFGYHTVIECHHPMFLNEAAKDKGTEQALESLKDLLLNLPDTKSVIFYADKVDGKLKFNKWLLKEPTVQVQPFESFKFWETDKATQYLLHVAHQHEVNITPPAAEQLVMLLGVERRLLSNEVQKLALLKNLHPTITPAVIDALGYHSDNVFRLVDRWLTQSGSAAVMDDLQLVLQHRHPVECFALIQGYVNTLFKICYLAHLGLQPPRIADKTGQKPFTIKKHLQTFRSVPAQRWLWIKQQLVELEWKTKSGQLDGTLALELLLCQ